MERRKFFKCFSLATAGIAGCSETTDPASEDSTSTSQQTEETTEQETPSRPQDVDKPTPIPEGPKFERIIAEIKWLAIGFPKDKENYEALRVKLVSRIEAIQNDPFSEIVKDHIKDLKKKTRWFLDFAQTFWQHYRPVPDPPIKNIINQIESLSTHLENGNKNKFDSSFSSFVKLVDPYLFPVEHRIGFESPIEKHFLWLEQMLYSGEGEFEGQLTEEGRHLISIGFRISKEYHRFEFNMLSRSDIWPKSKYTLYEREDSTTDENVEYSISISYGTRGTGTEACPLDCHDGYKSQLDFVFSVYNSDVAAIEANNSENRYIESHGPDDYPPLKSVKRIEFQHEVEDFDPVYGWMGVYDNISALMNMNSDEWQKKKKFAPMFE